MMVSFDFMENSIFTDVIFLFLLILFEDYSIEQKWISLDIYSIDIEC